MTLLHQAPNQLNGIYPPEESQDATGDLIDSKPFEGLVGYHLGWPDRHWYKARLATNWSQPGLTSCECGNRSGVPCIHPQTINHILIGYTQCATPLVARRKLIVFFHSCAGRTRPGFQVPAADIPWG